jgi:hypothetical protein
VWQYDYVLLLKHLLKLRIYFQDGREFRVGDCALFQAVDVPPFIGLIRWIEKKEEGFPKLRVSWLYRSADVKLNKAIQLNAAPNEIFYSFHQDETSAVSLLHPCKVAFLRKGVELPAGISSFVCRRVYDIDNKCLWWLTDKDYINVSFTFSFRIFPCHILFLCLDLQSGTAGRSKSTSA